MKTNWTRIYKPQVEAQLKAVGFSPKSEFGKLVIKAHKAQNTLINKLYSGTTWESMTYLPQYSILRDTLEDLGASDYMKSKHQADWKKFCDSVGTCWDANAGDWLC